jgi:hypothetical protein
VIAPSKPIPPANRIVCDACGAEVRDGKPTCSCRADHIAFCAVLVFLVPATYIIAWILTKL